MQRCQVKVDYIKDIFNARDTRVKLYANNKNYSYAIYLTLHHHPTARHAGAPSINSN